jgi:hypothetical protein
MTNITLFDQYTAEIFSKLYESFPVKIELEVKVFTGEKENDFGVIVNAEGHPSKHAQICIATIEWLVDTGYIRADRMDQNGATGAVLSSKGLEVLKSSWEDQHVKQSIGDKIVGFIKTGSKELAMEAAKAAISAGISVMGK